MRRVGPLGAPAKPVLGAPPGGEPTPPAALQAQVPPPSPQPPPPLSPTIILTPPKEGISKGGRPPSKNSVTVPYPFTFRQEEMSTGGLHLSMYGCETESVRAHRQLLALYAVKVTGSFRDAARLMGYKLSPSNPNPGSAVYRLVKDLEANIGVRSIA